MRLYEVAQSVGMKSKELMAALEENGIIRTSHLEVLSSNEVEFVKSVADVVEHKEEPVVVSSKKGVRALKNVLSSIKGVPMSKIVVSNTDVKFEVTRASANALELDVASRFVEDGTNKVYLESHTDTIISVEFNATGGEAQKQRTLQKSKMYRTVAVNLDTSDIISIYSVGGKNHRRIKYYSVRAKVFVDTNLEDLKSKGYGLYIAGSFSPSEGRKESTTLYKANDSKELIRKIDKLTFGALGRVTGKTLSVADAQKKASRMGQWKTGMSHTEPTNLISGFYVGKWELEGTEFADGKAYLLDTKAEKDLSTDKYKIERHAIEGLLIQNRPYSVFKTMSKVTNSQYIKEKILVDADRKDDNIVWINKEEVTPEIQSEFDKIWDGGPSEFDGKIVIIKSVNDEKNLADVQYYSDLNGIKASYNIKLDTGLNILSIDKPIKGGTVNTNTQMLETLAYINGMKLKDIMKDISSNFNKKKVGEVFNKKAAVPSIDEVENNYVAGLVNKIAPDFAKQNKKLFSLNADQAVQSMVKAANKLAYKVPGNNRIVQMDFAADFGVKVLPAGSVFAPGIKERNIFAKRAPKMSIGEFLFLRNLTLQEVYNFIDESDLSKTQKKLVKKEYRLLSESAVVIPAEEQYKDATGGMDFDGDTLFLFTYRKFSELLKNGDLKSNAIVVRNKKAKNDKVEEFSFSSIHNSFIQLISSGNMSIGEITFMNNFLLGLLFDLQRGVNKPALEFFKYAGNNGKGKAEYTPLDKELIKRLEMEEITVSFEVMDEVVETIKSIDLSKENMINVLEDLNSIFMMLQMETIDAPKQFTIVPVPYSNMLDRFTQNSKTSVDVDLNIVHKTKSLKGYKTIGADVKYLVETREGWHAEEPGNEDSPLRFYHKDLLHDIRIDAVKDTIKQANELKNFYNNIEYDEEIQSLFISAVDSASKGLDKDMVELKYLYNSINAGIRENEDQEPYYNEYIESLANTGRLITTEMTDEERSILAEGVSMPSLPGRNHSSFAMNTFKDEYLHMVMNNFSEVKVAGDKITHKKNIQDGDIMYFNFGVSRSKTVDIVDGKEVTVEKLAATKSDITGKFLIKDIDGSLYATRELTDMIPESTLTNKVIFRAISDNAKKTATDLVNAENVEFKIVYGKGSGSGDLVIADGKAVGKFITPPGMGRLNRLYTSISGKISNLMVVQETMNNGELRDVVIGIVENESEVDSDYVINNAKKSKTNNKQQDSNEQLNSTESQSERIEYVEVSTSDDNDFFGDSEF